MFNLSISSTIIQAELNEIFRRIELASTPEDRKAEADYAWFQIRGMYKFLKIGGVMTFTLVDSRNSEDYLKYERLLQVLDEASLKVEQIFDEYCRSPQTNRV